MLRCMVCRHNAHRPLWLGGRLFCDFCVGKMLVGDELNRGGVLFRMTKKSDGSHQLSVVVPPSEKAVVKSRASYVSTA